MTCKTPGTLYDMEAHGNVITYKITLPAEHTVKETDVKSLERIFHDEAERVLDYVTSDNVVASKAKILDIWCNAMTFWFTCGMLAYWLIGLLIIPEFSFDGLKYLLIGLSLITSILVIGACIARISYCNAKGK